MDCPRCNVEMPELAGDDMVMRQCGTCAGLWMDLADLNKILLHSNLPALQSLGGRVNPEASEGHCSECQVDLLCVEGGERRSLHYQTCEVCGGIFVEDLGKAETLQAATGAAVGFFKRFKNSKG